MLALIDKLKSKRVNMKGRLQIFKKRGIEIQKRPKTEKKN